MALLNWRGTPLKVSHTEHSPYDLTTLLFQTLEAGGNPVRSKKSFTVAAALAKWECTRNSLLELLLPPKAITNQGRLAPQLASCCGPLLQVSDSSRDALERPSVLGTASSAAGAARRRWPAAAPSLAGLRATRPRRAAPQRGAEAAPAGRAARGARRLSASWESNAGESITEAEG